jgi:hypothetical protein
MSIQQQQQAQYLPFNTYLGNIEVNRVDCCPFVSIMMIMMMIDVLETRDSCWRCWRWICSYMGYSYTATD